MLLHVFCKIQKGSNKVPTKKQISTYTGPQPLEANRKTSYLIDAVAVDHDSAHGSDVVPQPCQKRARAVRILTCAPLTAVHRCIRLLYF